MIVGQCELTVTFFDRYPVSEGHTLVIPKRHIETFFEATKEEVAAMMEAVRNAKTKLDKDFSPYGYNIGANNGECAGQTVPHLHFHVIPRYKGDVKNPRGGIRWVIPDKANYWIDDV